MPEGQVLQIAPILVIFFNRPNNLEQLLAVLERENVKDLYFACDGPRNKADETAIKACWDMVSEKYPNLSSDRLMSRSENLGCRVAVSDAITWFFSKVERGIILEDDCIPNHEFFRVLTEGLENYSRNNLIFSISASNPFGTSKNNGQSYLSIYPQIWGWATWSNRWSLYLRDFADGREVISEMLHRNLRGMNALERWTFRSIWNRILSLSGRGLIDTWDYSMLATMWRHGKFSLQLSGNYVKNIGFDANATHTKRKPFWVPSDYWGTSNEFKSDILTNPKLDSWLSINVYRCTLSEIFKNIIKDFLKALRLRS